ncbi:hypothetical protein FACS18949_07050 [Clostridia bacterium]|nr:hypothetical protein FACS189425_05380 [Clostridia bacterium]GHV33344.1 hypothetical protein FACS18949_07050 [Clostridia bacterium]
MLYQLNIAANKDEYRKVKRVSLADIGWKELDLQNLLSKNLFDLISSTDLMTIFNERPRQEEPDILALDKKGDLYIFELKRWSGYSENLLQVLRYGQLFGNSDYDELNELYRKYEKQPNADLLAAHASYFSLENDSGLKKDEFNRKQHFLVVVNGLDQKTVEAILYWKKNGLSIDAVIYWVFDVGGEYFIEFNMYSPTENLLEYETNYYVLNTDYSNNPLHTDEMLSEKKAAAYCPGWREKIQKLQKGDTVFLYKSGTGIIAYGEADGTLQKADCDGKPDYEYFMRLNKFCVLKKPISAARMKEITNQGFPFRTTMFSLPEAAAKLLIKKSD